MADDMKNCETESTAVHRERGYWRLVDRHYRWNFGVTIAQGSFALLSMAVFMPGTVLATYMTTLTDSKFLIGLPWALSLFYWSFPALFYSYFLQRRRQRLRTAVVLSAFVRVAFSLMALSALLAPRFGPVYAIVIFFAGEGVLLTTAGGAVMAWQDTLGRVLPPKRRAWTFGLREASGHLTGFAASAALFWYLKGRGEEPGDYMLPFAVAAVFYWVSLALFAIMREPRWPREPRVESSWQSYYARTFSLLATDRNFRTYVLIRCLTAATAIFNFGLFASYAIDEFGVSKAVVAGAFNAVWLGGRVLAGPIAGRLGDRKGCRVILSMGMAMLALVFGVGLALEWLGPLAMVGFVLIYILNGAAGSTIWMAEFNLVLEFGSVEDRPRYIAVAAACAGPVGLVAAAMSGYLVDLVGYPPVLSTALVATLVTLAVIRLVFREPRPSAPDASSQSG